MKTLIAILAILFILGCAQAPAIAPESVTEKALIPGCIKSEFGDYSYQGHIDPQLITMEWEMMEEFTKSAGPGQLETYYKPYVKTNPEVAVFLVYMGEYIGYAYLLDGSVYLYLLDLDSKCYIGKQLEGDAAPRFKRKLGEALGMKSI